MDLHKTYSCKICDKKYKHRQSLNKHINTKHNPNISINDDVYKPNINIKTYNDKPYISINTTDNIVDNDDFFKCRFCDKKYMHYQSRWRHEKLCKDNLIVQNQKLKEEVENIKEQMKEQIMDILKKECKMHPKTLQKINKQLEQNQNNTNCGIVNNGNINNITNNFNIIQLGEENLTEILSKKEQIMILNKKHQSLNHYIEMVHFNDKFPQFKNIAITNMKDDLAHMYDKGKNKFIAIKKDELLNTVIEMRMLDIEDFYNNNENDLDQKTKANIKKFIDKMSKDDKYFEFKKSDIKLLLYNNSDSDVIKKLEY
jgi:hypothetical protein